MQSATRDEASLEAFLSALEHVGADGVRPDLKELVGRATALFDEASAKAQCQSLIERLSADPSDRLALESLLVIGLAQPEVAAALRIPVVQEGRRLAVVLERAKDPERAQALLELLLSRNPADRALERELSGVMRRNGNLARLVERHLARADECVREGRREDAVRWLREVLMLDPQRRDVARMIRDLNYADVERRGAWRKGLKAAALSVLCLGAASGVVLREVDIDARFERIPQASSGDLPAMQARLNALDELVAQSPLWMGLFRASRERAGLRERVEKLRAETAERETKEAQARALAATLAESQYSLARIAAENYHFGEMRQHLEAALSYAPRDWAERAQIQRELAALEARGIAAPSVPTGERP